MGNASIGRRKFATLLGGAAAWPFAARAQPAPPVVGFMNAVARNTLERFIAALRAGLAQTGFEEGRNVGFEFRFADGDYDRLPALARELVGRRVAVIVAAGGPPSALAAKAATATIPIVFTGLTDPMIGGLVKSLSRPGGNATGISMLTFELDPKRLELLCEMLPTVRNVGAVVNPSRPDVESQVSAVQAAAGALGRRMVLLPARNESEIDAAFASLRQHGIGALVVLADPYFTSRREQIVALARRHGVPAIYQWRDFAVSGGLMSYGPSLSDAYHQAGIYAGRILKGEKPADLPVLQATKFEMVVNAKTARALGLAVTEAMLSRADEVIE